MKFDLVSMEASTITLSIGKKYLDSIVDYYVQDTDEKAVAHKEVNYFVNSIENKKDSIYKFKLFDELHDFLMSEDSIGALAYELRNAEEDFSYWHLLKHMQNTYKWFEGDKINKKVHLWFKLFPKEPTDYKSLGDTLPDYASIMCKFSLKQYVKYTYRELSSAEGWTYQICLLYLILINYMYFILKKYISDVGQFFEICFNILNPLIVGFTVKLGYSLGECNALDLIFALSKLTSCGKHLTKKNYKSGNVVEFAYHIMKGSFHHSDVNTEASKYRCDNRGKRLVKLLVSGKQNILSFSIDVIGLNAINDITGYAVNKTFYDFITDKNYFHIICCRVLSIILSNTVEYFESNKFEKLTSPYIFTMNKELLKIFNLERNNIDYLIIANELSNLEDKAISSVINHLGSKQQALIRKMVKSIKECKKIKAKSPIYYLYRKVNFK